MAAMTRASVALPAVILIAVLGCGTTRPVHEVCLDSSEQLQWVEFPPEGILDWEPRQDACAALVTIPPGSPHAGMYERDCQGNHSDAVWRALLPMLPLKRVRVRPGTSALPELLAIGVKGNRIHAVRWREAR